MRQVLFIGDLDKTDLLFYIAKLISLDKKVLIADYTLTKRYEFAYPKVEMCEAIQQYDYFDVAEGLNKYSDLESILNKHDYDIVLVDIEKEQSLKNWPNADSLYLITSYENPVIQRNLKLTESFFHEKLASELVPVTKIIYEVHGTLNEDYINDLMDKFPIHWEETLIFYPDERDLTRKISNQYSSSVKLKGLSGPFKEVIKSVAGKILDSNSKETNVLWKQAERRK
ncbi:MULTISPECIES: hypothetical protein [Paenibacillus]|uniref:Uncharacterized protein n=1 Tax=Paenibacillus lautus TaxID=1401 RepID=A0A385TYL8_PAELA|nr:MULTISPECIES: hypothetical protein [Paenibacillus]AWP25203.1 hypothetical protein B9D94_00530 [Paenibacillus sp. Cedars]AYB48034.1 hypothetical protein D5F53_32420 [Paenibacillus lautus]MBX4152582.1 hypothetical protein [Paenibacillus lautus]